MNYADTIDKVRNASEQAGKTAASMPSGKADVWDEDRRAKSHWQCASRFFDDLVDGLLREQRYADDPSMQSSYDECTTGKRLIDSLKDVDWSRPLVDVYYELNEPRHPVRNNLLCHNTFITCNALDE